jgi:tagatose-6-phosphate ketose/aldose isomerase
METALTKLLGSSPGEKRQRGILYTPQEIHDQVELWGDTCRRFKAERRKLAEFLGAFNSKSHRAVVCTGAGTSEFVGYCLEALLRRKWRIPVNVVSTPKIVTTPQDFSIEGYATLLLSFARSGNSPESLGAVKIADMLCRDVHHLVITCNERGALFREVSGRADGMALLLDERTNDSGLAMTASFSNMVVAGQMLSHLYSFEEYEKGFDNLLQAGKAMLERAPDVAEEIAQLGFERAVFLGDGGNVGTAAESHLKLQELTAGRVMCTWDTFAGLRHGPEAVIDANTLVVAYLAADGFARRYELDLLQEIREKGIGKALLTVAHALPEEIKGSSDYTIEYGTQADPLPDDLIPPVYIIVGQLLGLFASLRLGLRPDDPSESGIIHRVVEGVRVYDPQVYRRSGRTEVITER